MFLSKKKNWAEYNNNSSLKHKLMLFTLLRPETIFSVDCVVFGDCVCLLFFVSSLLCNFFLTDFDYGRLSLRLLSIAGVVVFVKDKRAK